jgi:predicted transcriptional regulator
MNVPGETRKIVSKEAEAEEVTQKQARDITHLAICSDLRRNILVFLSEGEKSLGDLRENLNVSSTTVIHALRELERHNLTFQDHERNYQLTTIGTVVAHKITDFSNTAEALARAEELLLEHDISGIPTSLLQKLGCLKDATLITIDSTDLYKIHNIFMNSLKGVKEINGISPIFVSDYPTVFEEILNHQVEVQLILTPDVLEKVVQAADKESLLKALDGNLKLYIIKQNPKVAFTSTEKFVFLGLYNQNGSYDVSKLLMGQSNKAIEWGRALFEHYVRLSSRITLQE